MVSRIWIVSENTPMPNDLDYVKHMMPPHRDHPWSGFGDLVAKPVGREPQIPDWSSENFDCYPATAKRGPGASLRVLHDTHHMGFAARSAYDRRCYLIGLAAIGFGLAVMLGALAVLGPNWLTGYFAATPHVAVNDSWYSVGAATGSPDTKWCSGFDGLSCKQQDTARE